MAVDKVAITHNHKCYEQWPPSRQCSFETGPLTKWPLLTIKCYVYDMHSKCFDNGNENDVHTPGAHSCQLHELVIPKAEHRSVVGVGVVSDAAVVVLERDGV